MNTSNVISRSLLFLIFQYSRIPSNLILTLDSSCEIEIWWKATVFRWLKQCLITLKRFDEEQYSFFDKSVRITIIKNRVDRSSRSSNDIWNIGFPTKNDPVNVDLTCIHSIATLATVWCEWWEKAYEKRVNDHCKFDKNESLKEIHREWSSSSIDFFWINNYSEEKNLSVLK